MVCMITVSFFMKSVSNVDSDLKVTFSRRAQNTLNFASGLFLT